MLVINNLGKSFGKQVVLKDFSHTFKEGKIYALMGANGSGKTTLFNIIGSFLSADEGNITFKGKNIISILPHQVAQLGICRTFQNLRLMPSLSVIDNIYLALKNKTDEKIVTAFFGKTSRTYYQEKIHQLLATTHLDRVKNSLAKNISYGQQKLLTLAIAMANDFDLLLLDEPVAGVQVEYRKQISTILKKMNKTIILIEHNAEFIQNLTDNVVFLDQGKVIAQGDYQAIKNNPQVQEAYL